MFQKLSFLIVSSIFLIPKGFGQNLPTKEWITNSHDKPLIFYISGDGGFNKFSTALCESFSKKGYDVCALNARSYFNNKKTPEQND